LPGKILPALPKKNKSNSTAANLLGSITGGGDSEASSVSSVSTQQTGAVAASGLADSLKTLTVRGMMPLLLLMTLCADVCTRPPEEWFKQLG